MKSGAFAVWAAAVVTILPMHVFAQREHIALLTFLPALAVYALRSNREPLPLWAILIAGAGAGITLAFKPFFAVPVALCILFAAIRSRSWRVLFAPENIIAGVIVTIVSLGTYFFYSEYFTITYPLVRDTYLSWSMPAAVIFLNDATMIFAIALCRCCWRAKNRSRIRRCWWRCLPRPGLPSRSSCSGAAGPTTPTRWSRSPCSQWDTS